MESSSESDEEGLESPHNSDKDKLVNKTTKAKAPKKNPTRCCGVCDFEVSFRALFWLSVVLGVVDLSMFVATLSLSLTGTVDVSQAMFDVNAEAEAADFVLEHGPTNSSLVYDYVSIDQNNVVWSLQRMTVFDVDAWIPVLFAVASASNFLQAVLNSSQNGQLREWIAEGRNPVRWLEFAFNAPLLLSIVAAVSGMQTFGAYLGVILISASAMILTMTLELNTIESEAKYLLFVIASVLCLSAWAIVLECYTSNLAFVETVTHVAVALALGFYLAISFIVITRLYLQNTETEEDKARGARGRMFRAENVWFACASTAGLIAVAWSIFGSEL